MLSNGLSSRLANAAPSKTRGARIAEGKHSLVLKQYGLKPTKERGTILAADFLVAQSDTHPIGSIVSVAWFVSDMGWKGDNELSRARDFVAALIGAKDPGTIEQTVNQLATEAQPGRGIVITAFGVKSKNFVDIMWEHVPQTPEQIANQRRQVEAASPAPAANPPAPAPVVQQTPATPAPSTSLLGGLFGGQR